MIPALFYFDHPDVKKGATCSYSTGSANGEDLDFVELTILTGENLLRGDGVYIFDSIQDICAENLIEFKVDVTANVWGLPSGVEVKLRLNLSLPNEGYIEIAQTVVSLIWGIDAGQAALVGENIKAAPMQGIPFAPDESKLLKAAILATEKKKAELRLEKEKLAVQKKQTAIALAKAKETTAKILERMLAIETIEPLDDRSW
jgi:hypothetical protein